MRIANSCLGLLLGAASALPVAGSGAAALEIMSFNVQQPHGTNWEGRRDKAVAQLSLEDPDIVGTQEAMADQRNYLLGKLPRYGAYGVGRDGGEAGEGSWILYRKERFTVDSAQSGNFWLSSTPDRPSRYGGSYNRLCTHVRLVEKGTGRSLHLFNAHFYMPNENAWRQQAARQMAAEMARLSKAGVAVVATGDFNSSESDAVTACFKSGSDNPLPLRDTYRDYAPTGSVETGFGTKFDYIYVPKVSDWKTLKAWVAETHPDASDHLPVSASLEWPAPTVRIAPRPRPAEAPYPYDILVRADGRVLCASRRTP